jgi:RHS repeat-associated protein
MAYAQTSSQPLTQASTLSMTIEGEITLTWVGAASAIPTGSRLGVTINAGQAPCVVGVGGGSGSGTGGTGTTTTATAQNYYIHADHLGSPRTITRASDNVKVWEWKNDDAFGNNAADENPNGANSVNGAAAAFTYNLRFPGQYFDKETNTNYNYFRDYDPTTGRYVQSDPIGLKGGINTFGYVTQQPTRYIDPEGLRTERMMPQSCQKAKEKGFPFKGWVQCDGRGGFEIYNCMPSDDCTRGCLQRHEEDHVRYLQSKTPSACANRPRGVAPFEY